MLSQKLSISVRPSNGRIGPPAHSLGQDGIDVGGSLAQRALVLGRQRCLHLAPVLGFGKRSGRVQANPASSGLADTAGHGQPHQLLHDETQGHFRRFGVCVLLRIIANIRNILLKPIGWRRIVNTTECEVMFTCMSIFDS